MTEGVAIIGMGCCYPDARAPGELWENVLAQRRAFRRMPPERLRLEDYYSTDRDAPDSIYSSEAAVIKGYDFDRVRFRVAGSTFRSADLAHWLALDVAAQALADAGFEEGANHLRHTTGVFVGNTLTGEFSRANTLRLRWPYLRRVVEAELKNEGWTLEQRRRFAKRLEATFKEPFPAIGEESLAGGLSNTIAGRICNHFDFKGGGHTVDGACASSLLAVINACSALTAGDLDMAVAGGVDLSMDPFELVGFAKTGALAAEKMRIYDARSAGFWPGEGCGFVVLMRYADAISSCRRIYAIIRGWGISSDGSGGITRPEVDGQLLALRRAYNRTGFGIETVGYFEGHGTGTSVGDATELKVLSTARRDADQDAPPAVISSIKGIIGHTKAAAGVAGLIKATLAVNSQILPPMTGCDEPHAELCGDKPALRVLRKGEPWPVDIPLRAGVSAMGFGGINTHVVLEAAEDERRNKISLREQLLLSTPQDAEVFLLRGDDAQDLLKQTEDLAKVAAGLSWAEVGDLASHMASSLKGEMSRRGDCFRAAIVASTPFELKTRLELLGSWVKGGSEARLDSRAGVFLGRAVAPRIGFLFPGQSSPTYLDGGAFAVRYDEVSRLYREANLPKGLNASSTALAQPAIVTASIAGLRLLDKFGVKASVSVGHSLGEITALHWAGAFDEEALLRIAAARGRAMLEFGSPTGAMASIKATEQQVRWLLNGDKIVISGINSPSQTVISGEAFAIDRFIARALANKIGAVRLPVSHAFHSSLVAAATPMLAEFLRPERFRPLSRTVISTVTGSALNGNDDLKDLLLRQVISPVRFMQAIIAEAENVDLWIEVGPGQVLGNLAGECVSTPVVSTDAGGPSLRGLLAAVGAAYALGAPVNHETIFEGRFARAINLDSPPRFFVSPCEVARVPDDPAEDSQTEAPPYEEGREELVRIEEAAPSATGASPLELVRQIIAERIELDVSAVNGGDRLLRDLHLNSITVSQVAAEAARRMGLQPPVSPTDYSNVTVAELAAALEELASIGGASSLADEIPPGAGAWIRTFTVDLVERPLPPRAVSDGDGGWHLIAPPGYPLATVLQEAFAGLRSGGVMVCLPPHPDQQHVGLLLEGARRVFEDQAAQFVLVQHGGGAAAFARTLFLEAPDVVTCVVDVPIGHPEAARWITEEARHATGYAEAHYDALGCRREPRLRLLAGDEEEMAIPLGREDCLLVSGGGKGIAAECSFMLARQSGARLVLLGRSDPAEDEELAANLERMTAASIQFLYITTDVTDADAVNKAVSEAEARFGPITGILHSAGANVPRLLSSLDEEAFLNTLAPKVRGARNLLAAVNPDRLKLFVTFGSLIARAGMRGEADYAVANEWLSRLTEQWQEQHPHCRCLAVEWSVWSGVGMGQRLGRVDALRQQGITPIPPDEGIAIFSRLLSQKLTPTCVMVTGRFGASPTLKMEEVELPLLRFLEEPKVYYPGIELIADTKLSADADLYLNDHVFHGERIFPGVMGLEAMAQTARALVGRAEPFLFEEVQFNRPIIVPDGSALTIRVAAIAEATDRINLVVRSEETAFQVDHFRAIARLYDHPIEEEPRPQAPPDEQPIAVSLDPNHDLYGDLLFHGGRFRRLQRYRKLRTKECMAEIAPDGVTDWFGMYLPTNLILGDPGARDAAIHAVQACVPHARLLPIGIDRLVLGQADPAAAKLVHATERSRHADLFVYDLEVSDFEGRVLERYEGLRLRRVEGIIGQGQWPVPLLGTYVERRIEELLPGAPISIAIQDSPDDSRSARSDHAIRRVLGSTVTIQRRSDGKPEVAGDSKVAISLSHTGPLTMAVAGPRPIGCDIEQSLSRPYAVWRGLLRKDGFALARILARESGEDEATAATRVWAAMECLTKAGSMLDAPLVSESFMSDGWALLRSGSNTIATFAARVRGVENQVVLAVLAPGNGSPAAEL